MSRSAWLYGSPYHYGKEQGERSILSAKTAFSYVVQFNEELPSPVVWLSTNTPAENPFVPFAISKMPVSFREITLS